MDCFLVANKINDYFIEKVRLLRERTDIIPKTDRVLRLKKGLNKSGKSVPPFQLQSNNSKKLTVLA